MKNKIKFILPIILLLATIRSYADLVIVSDRNSLSGYATVSYVTHENGSSTLTCTGQGNLNCEAGCNIVQLTYGAFSFAYAPVIAFVWDKIINHSMPSGSTLYLGVVPISWTTSGGVATINIATDSDLDCNP